MAAGETESDLLALMQFEGTPAVLAGVPVLGIFDEPAVVDPLSGLGIAVVQPQYSMPASMVPQGVEDMPLALRVRGIERRFTVREHMPDGTGLVVLKLSDAP